MDTTWILVADRSRARIFEETGQPRALHEIADFFNPLGRASDRELETDAAGRSLSTSLGTRAHSESSGVSPTQHEAERFSRELRDYLESGRTGHRYARLWVIAPPRFLALMRKTLGKEVRKLIEQEIDKDVSRADASEIEALVTGRRESQRQ